MEIQRSQNNDIEVIEGNGFAIYISPNGQALVKDSNGAVASLADLLGALEGDQNNIATFLRASPFDEPIRNGEGSLKQRLVSYVNSLGFNKTQIQCQIFVAFSTNPQAVDGNFLTPFATSGDSELDPCDSPDLSPYQELLYHNGESDFPVVGDQVFTDYNSQNEFVTPSGTVRQTFGGGYLRTDSNGFVVEIICL